MQRAYEKRKLLAVKPAYLFSAFDKLQHVTETHLNKYPLCSHYQVTAERMRQHVKKTVIAAIWSLLNTGNTVVVTILQHHVPLPIQVGSGVNTSTIPSFTNAMPSLIPRHTSGTASMTIATPMIRRAGLSKPTPRCAPTKEYASSGDMKTSVVSFRKFLLIYV